MFDAPHDDLIEYTSFVADIDFIALFGRPVRNIFIVDAGGGLMTVVCGESNPGPARALTAITVGYLEPSPFWVRKIVAGAGTDVAHIRVGL